MTTLAANIDDAQTLLPIAGPLTNGSFNLPLYYTIDSEAILVTGRAHRTTWLVERAIAGTTAASHSSGATLTRYYPDAEGAGGPGGPVAAEDVTVTPTVAGTSDVQAALEEGRGFYAQATDPGARGAGVVWYDIENELFWRRNDADDGWEPRFEVEVSGPGPASVSRTAIASSGNAEAKAHAVAEDGGDADASPIASTLGAGSAKVSAAATAEGSGNADARSYATTLGAGDAYAGSTAEALTGDARLGATATRDGISAGMTALVDETGPQLIFNGLTPIPIPVVPASPTEQDIVDALVALGIVTQAAP